MPKHWSCDDDQILQKYFSDHSNKEIQKYLPHKTEMAILRRAQRLGLHKSEEYIKSAQQGVRPRWKKEEIELLRSNYSKVNTKDLVHLFPDKSISSIQCKATNLGLVKQFETIQRITITCTLCGKTKDRYPSDVERDRGKFCSKKCKVNSQLIGKEVKCAYCGKENYFQPERIKRSENLFCPTTDCYAKYQYNKVPRACIVCGKVRDVKKYDTTVGWGRFCGKPCQKKYNGPSYLEEAIEKELISIGLPYQKEKHFWIYHADFFIAHLDLVIEVDGEQHERKKERERDKKRDKWFKKQGYITIRIKSKDIRKDPKAALLSKLPSLQGSLF